MNVLGLLEPTEADRERDGTCTVELGARANTMGKSAASPLLERAAVAVAADVADAVAASASAAAPATAVHAAVDADARLAPGHDRPRRRPPYRRAASIWSVSFAYPSASDEPILRDFSLRVDDGERRPHRPSAAASRP